MNSKQQREEEQHRTATKSNFLSMWVQFITTLCSKPVPASCCFRELPSLINSVETRGSDNALPVCVSIYSELALDFIEFLSNCLYTIKMVTIYKVTLYIYTKSRVSWENCKTNSIGNNTSLHI